MITVEEAKRLITANSFALSPAIMQLPEAAGKILAEDLVAPADIPAFPQSSMDGYAFSFDDWEQNKTLVIEGEIAAGSTNRELLPPGKAVRIFTGAPVPPGADTVVMQEKVTVTQTSLLINDEQLKKGANVRPRGSEIKKGMTALEKGQLLSPAAVGFIAGLGLSSASVIPAPRVSIIITGNELQKPGSPLAYGQVYESNSFSLTAALHDAGISNITTIHSGDNLDELTVLLYSALETSDLVLLTGGVSVGDYDFVIEASNRCKIETIFYKIKQRPGKPLFFGKSNKCLVFGLPGNPSSVLTCFYEYVLPAMELLTNKNLGLKTTRAKLAKPFKKSIPLTFFLKGLFDGRVVTILDAQESYKLSSYATANCLVKLDEEVKEFSPGEEVEVHLLPI